MIFINSFDNIFELARGKKATVVVAEACSEHIMDTVEKVLKQDLANMILVGGEATIKEVARSKGLDISKFEVINAATPEESCKIAVDAINNGKATSLMKGNVDTSIIMSAVLDREGGLRMGKKLSHIAAFKPPHYHKLIFASDCAINIAPDFEAKIDIIESAVAAVRNLGINQPKVALLAAKEKVDEKMPITQEWAKIVDIHRAGEKMQNCIIDGPLALDNAVSKQSCEIKGIDSPVGGDADILICPDIEAGNILYKSLSFMANAQNGGVVVGAKCPIVLTSRADSTESKLISIALSVLM